MEGKRETSKTEEEMNVQPGRESEGVRGDTM